MKILCISDQVDPLVYSSSIKERFGDVDFIVCAGDLPMEYIDFIVSSLNKPTFFIFGNHNLKEFGYYHKSEEHATSIRESLEDEYRHAHGALYLGFKTWRQGKTLLAGTSGSILYNKGLNQYSDRQMFLKLLRMVPILLYNKIRYGRYLDFFITHAPPEGIHDRNDPCHRGFKCYLWFLRCFKPAYMIHGHIHLYDTQEVRLSRFEDTTIINAYSHYIIETAQEPV